MAESIVKPVILTAEKKRGSKSLDNTKKTLRPGKGFSTMTSVYGFSTLVERCRLAGWMLKTGFSSL